MKLLVLTTLATATAFQQSAIPTRDSSLQAARGWQKTSPYKDEVGVVPPLGFFDPLGLLEDATTERFNRLRSSELKNGRVAMLAVVGNLVTRAGVRFPGAEDMPDGLAAIPAIPYQVVIQMLFTTALMEMLNRDAFGKAEFVGDFRNGYLDFGWDKFDEKTKLKKRNTELNQGRAAMMGITGLMVHDYMGNVDQILP